jgi:hypothetical protein
MRGAFIKINTSAIDNEPSTPYKEYITSIKTEYDKFWENKIKTHNNRLKELQKNE